MTRQTKTPQQRAQEQLDAAKRHKERLKTKRDALAAELDQVNREYEAAGARHSFLLKHPDLAQPTTPSTGGTIR
jgi:vacuolar-type H+-ATPase subunit D/Vma8